MGDPVRDVLGPFENSSSRLHLTDGIECDAAQLAIDGRRMAQVLTHQGVDHGDRVALQLPNSADYLRLFFACSHRRGRHGMA